MEFPHYRDGKWMPAILQDDHADGEDFEVWLKRIGYADFTSIGTVNASYGIRAWSRQDAPQYLIEFTDGNICPLVTAGTVGDALDLMARWAPIVTAGIIGDVAGGIWALEPDGFMTHVMAAIEVNVGAVSRRATQERELRERRRVQAEQRRAAKDASGA